MNKINELKYINMMPLRNLKRLSFGYMCSCPKCNEGKSPWRTRLYILTEKKSYITVYCHNCGYDTNLRGFIKEFAPYLYEEYKKEDREELLDGLKKGSLTRKEVKISSEINTDLILKYTFNLNTRYFKPAKLYREAVDFCNRRVISERIEDFYYNIHPNHPLSGMVIFPFYLKDKQTLYGFQGRHTSIKKFHTHSKNEAMKVYNFYNVDYDSNVYIFESIIDSFMIDNSIAMLGVSLSDSTMNKIKHKIFILDNDKRGIETAIKYAEEGKKIFIYPNSFKYKDFNEAVCKGVPKFELKQMVDENIHEGMSAIVRLNLMKSSRKL